MLQIVVPAVEYWDEANEEFIYKDTQTLQLEHSLVSISKWESKWQKPFLAKSEKTNEEILDYIRCMTITKNVDPEVYTRLSNENVDAINQYIESPMTATRITDRRKTRSKHQIITSELIYYWMIGYNIPVEFQKWHLNRLLTLIRVCEAENNPKKMSRKEIFAQNAAINEARKRQTGSKG